MTSLKAGLFDNIVDEICNDIISSKEAAIKIKSYSEVIDMICSDQKNR